jgi:hypothetical protein
MKERDVVYLIFTLCFFIFAPFFFDRPEGSQHTEVRNAFFSGCMKALRHESISIMDTRENSEQEKYCTIELEKEIH